MALSTFYEVEEVPVAADTMTAYTIPDLVRHVAMGVASDSATSLCELRLASDATTGKDLPLDFENEPELANQTVWFYSLGGCTVQILVRKRRG